MEYSFNYLECIVIWSRKKFQVIFGRPITSSLLFNQLINLPTRKYALLFLTVIAFVWYYLDSKDIDKSQRLFSVQNLPFLAFLNRHILHQIFGNASGATSWTAAMLYSQKTLRRFKTQLLNCENYVRLIDQCLILVMFLGPLVYCVYHINYAFIKQQSCSEFYLEIMNWNNLKHQFIQ